MLESYLEELDSELQKGLTSEEVFLRMTEVETHLRDGVQARVELGLDYEAAERETLAAFGKASQVAKSLNDSALGRYAAARLHWLGAYFTTVIVFVAAVGWLSKHVQNSLAIAALLMAVVVCVVGGSRAAFRSRKSALLPIFATGLAATMTIWIVMGTLYLNLYAFGGIGLVPRYGIADEVAELTARQRSAGPNSPVWEQPEAIAEELRAIERAQSDPIGNLVSHSGSALPTGLGSTGIAILLDIGFASLGAVALRRRKRGGLRA